ncbi:hypothetical protein Nepgr_017901 [Nepenthes gracilis]|uniref:Uncharacterized protein n=1 Tax=Nepenthes gracilis TaxID=150966 RepID=A0AAD3SSB4_NEPGR|nr:hypothetical protein Nepgr_017901 [Nepenthes gracilis]
MDFSHGTISVSLSTILFVASYLFPPFRQIKQHCRTTRLSGRENLTPMRILLLHLKMERRLACLLISWLPTSIFRLHGVW